MARNYSVPIQDGAQVGDIIVVGVYGIGAVGTTPTGWTLLAHIGTLCALYSHTVASGEPGTSVDFALGSNNKVACFVLAISGASGVTGRLSPSAGAVGAQTFTVSSSAAPLVIAGCFSTLTQTFTSPFAVSAPALGSPLGLRPVNSSGIGTNCPSVVFGPTTANSVLIFGAALTTALMAFELDVTGTTPKVYADFATTEGDIPASSPAFSQQTTGHGTATPFSMPALTVSLNDCLVTTAVFYNSTTGITETITDNNSGSWVEVTGLPNHEATSSFFIHNDIWYSVGHPSGSTTVKSTLSVTPTNIFMNLSVYTGIATASPVDTQTSAISSSTGSTAQTGTINTSNASDLLVGCVSTDSTQASSMSDYGSAGGTPTALTQPASLLSAGYQIVSATGNYGFQFNLGSVNDWAAAIVALKAAVGWHPIRHHQGYKKLPQWRFRSIHTRPYLLVRPVGVPVRMLYSRHAHPLPALPRTKLIKSSQPRILQRLIQPPAAKLGFAVRRVASRHRLKNNPLTRFIKSSFKRPLWLIQPPAAKLGVALREIVRKPHPVKLGKAWKTVKSSFNREQLLGPALLAFTPLKLKRPHRLVLRRPSRLIKSSFKKFWLIQPPASALGVALREIVRKAHPLKLGKPWKTVKSSFKRVPLLGPALLAFVPLKLKKPHRLTLRKPSALIKSGFRKFWLIQPATSALGIALHEVVHKARPVLLSKPWKSIKSTFRKPIAAAGPALLAFPPPKLKKEHRLVMRKASALIKSSFKKWWLIQPPAAKLGFPVTRLARRHLLRLLNASRLIKSTFRRPTWLIQPPAAKLGFPPTKLTVRHRLVLQSARKLIKSTFRAPRKLITPRSLGFPPTRLAKRHMVRLLKQASLIKSTFKRPLWLIQPPVAKLGFAVTRVAKRHSIRLLKPLGQVKSKFKRPTWLIQPPAAKLGFPPTRLTKRHLLVLSKAQKLIKSTFRTPRRLIQPPAAKLGVALREIVRKSNPVKLGKSWKTVKSSFRISRLQKPGLAGVPPRMLRDTHRLVLRKPSALMKSSFKKVWLIQPPVAKLGFAVTRVAKRQLLRLSRPARLVKSNFKRPLWLIQPPAAKLGMAVRLILHRQRVRPSARRRPVRTARILAQPVALVRRGVRRVQRGRAALLRRPRLRVLFVAPGVVLRIARHARRLARVQPRQVSPRRRAVFAVIFAVRGRVRRLVRRISPLARRQHLRLAPFGKPIIHVWTRMRPSRVKHQVTIWIRRWRRVRQFPRPIIDRDAPRVIIFATLDAAIAIEEATLTPVPAIVVSAALDRVVVIDEAFLGEV